MQSAKFIENHGGNINRISVFGQDSNPTTWKMAQMNLAIRGIEADLGRFNADTQEDKADFRFIYYYLKWKYKELSSLANGGAQQNLNAQLIKEFPILTPDLMTQQAIANILWEIDDKIELNQKINDNLQQQAFALFDKLMIDADNDVCTVFDYAYLNLGRSCPARSMCPTSSSKPPDHHCFHVAYMVQSYYKSIGGEIWLHYKYVLMILLKNRQINYFPVWG